MKPNAEPMEIAVKILSRVLMMSGTISILNNSTKNRKITLVGLGNKKESTKTNSEIKAHSARIKNTKK